MDNYSSYVIYPLFGLNTKNTGSTKIFTTENGTRNFYAVAAVFESTAASGITIAATASIGTNATSYNNVLPSTLLSGLLNAGVHLPVSFNSVAAIIGPGVDVFVNVTTASIGTSQTANLRLVGFYM